MAESSKTRNSRLEVDIRGSADLSNTSCGKSVRTEADPLACDCERVLAHPCVVSRGRSVHASRRDGANLFGSATCGDCTLSVQTLASTAASLWIVATSKISCSATRKASKGGCSRSATMLTLGNTAKLE